MHVTARQSGGEQLPQLPPGGAAGRIPIIPTGVHREGWKLFIQFVLVQLAEEDVKDICIIQIKIGKGI
ncbi:hypothetical protein Y1Q_0018650 [Alligator mississippiensis]|uniref:Uncharacterized protein n=1 Tax=Alligator mississippiensis TaxID=8496 RepID=A0A151NS05_ALLMI|nr:hypothetical protein Y1Q_0018650 [Alligator mississippiensis]